MDISYTIKDHNDFKYFDRSIIETQNHLQKYVDDMGKRLKIANHLDNEYTFSLTLGGIENALVYGRISKGFSEDEEKEKFSTKNLEIHFTSKFTISSLNLSIPSESEIYIFDGEIIAAQGHIQNRIFYVDQIYSDCREKLPLEISPNANAEILVFKGPYFKSSIEEIQFTNFPFSSTAIFLGPFISIQYHNHLLTDENCEFTAQELTEKVILKLTEKFQQPYFMLSEEDAVSYPIFPRNKIFEGSNKYIPLGDPAELDSYNFKLFLTSLETVKSILFNSFLPMKERPQFIAKLLAHQISACPVWNSIIQPQYIEQIRPSDTPHVMIFGAQLSPQINQIDSTCVCFAHPYHHDKSALHIEVSMGNFNVGVISDN